MAVPTNTVQQDGIGTVIADMYNTYVQSVAGLNGLSNFGTGGLQNFVGVSGMTVFVPGIISINDGDQGNFYWNATGNANDGVNNVQPNGVSLGCWTRVPAVLTGTQNLTNAINFASGGNVASAATTAIGAAPGNNVTITGTTTITAFDTVQAGTQREVTFAGMLTLTYNATSLILPTQANIVTAAGDTSGWLSLGSGNWICIWYQRANGQALVSPAAVRSIHNQSFTSPGTYTPTTGMIYAVVKIVGGGGGSGGAANEGGSGGGGSGGFGEVLLTAAQIGSSQVVTIGTGGSAGTTTGDGGTGGTTSLGSLISCTGGSGGAHATGTGNNAGGNGGVCTVSTGVTIQNIQGQDGGYGSASSSGAFGGQGGSNPLGFGAPAANQWGTGANLGGFTATGYGSGASGNANQSGSSVVGAAGQGGEIIILEYCTQ